MKQNENQLPAVLSTQDLQGAGITAQLNQNDLVEVVAHDIYDKYVAELQSIIKRGEKLSKEGAILMNPELDKMKKSLSGFLKKEKISVVVDKNDEDYDEDDEDNYDGLVASFEQVNKEYWPYISIKTVKIVEKERGTFVEEGHNSVRLPDLKKKSVKIRLTLTSSGDNETKEVKIGNVKGKIETKVSKSFEQEITVGITRFKDYQKRVVEYNKDLEVLKSFLPKTGLLSVERFTREARVKMNKRILRQQPKEFREKVSKLFNIEL